MALDYILAKQGGLCVALNLTGDACYTLIPDNSDNMTSVRGIEADKGCIWAIRRSRMVCEYLVAGELRTIWSSVGSDFGSSSAVVMSVMFCFVRCC